jgi:hypothetical protein
VNLTLYSRPPDLGRRGRYIRNGMADALRADRIPSRSESVTRTEVHGPPQPPVRHDAGAAGQIAALQLAGPLPTAIASRSKL